MKRLFCLCLIPLLAGCFAWDLDEKPLPWYPDPPENKPSIGTVIYHSAGKQPAPAPMPATYIRNAAPAAPAAPAPVQPAAPAEPFAPAPPEVVVEPVAPQPVKAAAPAPKAEGGATEKRLSNLESRLEDLYQLILKSYEKDKK
jgi:hypothetical protein